MRPWLAVGLLFPGMVACVGRSGDSPGPGPAGDADVDSEGAPESRPPPSDNVIDVAIWPSFTTRGLAAPKRAGTVELCRRLSLDLFGTIPSRDDLAFCDGKTPAQIAEAFMARPEFTTRERALWIQHLREDPSRIAAEYCVDADKIIDALSSGKLAYDAFAARILAHPVMALNHTPFAGGYDDGSDHKQDVAKNAYRVFLGRVAVGLEARDLANLFRGWKRVELTRSKTTGSWFHRDGDMTDGITIGLATLTVKPCTDSTFGSAPCTSRLIGDKTTLALPATYEGAAYESFAGSVPEALQTELEKPGRLLSTRQEFWDEAADHALQRFLGWWKSTLAEPDTDVPEVRAALSKWFRATPDHDIRKLYATIIGSLLYSSAAAVDAGTPEALPVWAAGPTKELEPTQWADSVGKVWALALNTGFCDVHTSDSSGYPLYFPNSLRAPSPVTKPYGYAGFYQSFLADLGGCKGAVAPSRDIFLSKVFIHASYARSICMGSELPIAPDGYDFADVSEANVRKLLSFAFVRLLSREPNDVELAASIKASGCLKATCDLKVFAGELCSGILRSTGWTFY